MRTTYKALGHTISGLVVVQAAAMAFAVFGLLHWVDGGKSYTPAINDDEAKGVTGAVGFAIHSMGANLIALLAIILLVLSLFAKIEGGAKWAGFLFLAVLLQWILAFISFGAPVVGLLHGGNAIAIAWLGWRVAKQADLAIVGPRMHVRHQHDVVVD